MLIVVSPKSIHLNIMQKIIPLLQNKGVDFFIIRTTLRIINQNTAVNCYINIT